MKPARVLAVGNHRLPAWLNGCWLVAGVWMVRHSPTRLQLRVRAGNYRIPGWADLAANLLYQSRLWGQGRLLP